MTVKSVTRDSKHRHIVSGTPVYPWDPNYFLISIETVINGKAAVIQIIVSDAVELELLAEAASRRYKEMVK
jgi:hypothetical protein